MKKMTLTFIAAYLLYGGLSSQTVTTFTQGTPDDAIVLDLDGNIYCSNYSGESVFKFTTIGDASPFVSGLNTPNGLAFNSNQDLFVCDGAGNTIFKYDAAGNLLESFSNTGHPSGIIKSHDSETMIFTEYVGNTINTLAPDGTITEISSDPLLVGPVGLAYGENNDLYIGNFTNRKIYKILAGGDLQYIATVGAASNLGFIAYAQGMLWGTVLGEHKIYKINPNEVDDVTLFAGSTGGNMDGDISEATFNQPNGIIFNASEDTMYITDYGSKNLRIISDIVLSSELGEVKKNSFKLFPNPAKDQLHIQGKLEQDGYYVIKAFDVLGNLVFSSEGISNYMLISSSIDISNWSQGTYIFKITAGNQTEIQKIVK